MLYGAFFGVLERHQLNISPGGQIGRPRKTAYAIHKHTFQFSLTCWPLVSVRFIREELSRLQEAGSYVGEVVKVMGKNKVLVKVRCNTI
jgi:hypothetical protein